MSAIRWICLLFGIFIIKKGVEFSLTSFGTLKDDCIMKTKIFNSVPLINNSVTIG